MNERQYVAVSFRPGDAKTYTYHNDGARVVCGDVVKVPSRFGDAGWRRATVVKTGVERPTAFATKGILGLVDQPPLEGKDT